MRFFWGGRIYRTRVVLERGRIALACTWRRDENGSGTLGGTMMLGDRDPERRHRCHHQQREHQQRCSASGDVRGPRKSWQQIPGVTDCGDGFARSYDENGIEGNGGAPPRRLDHGRAETSTGLRFSSKSSRQPMACHALRTFSQLP